jgi:hypothetical protein
VRWAKEKDLKGVYIRTTGAANSSFSFITDENNVNLTLEALNKVSGMQSISNNNNTNTSSTHRLTKKEPCSIHIRHQRVIIGNKETIEGTLPPNTNPQKDWTGTFTDPRFRSPDPENSLTGQTFGVNGPRSDYMEIGKNDAKLRFWRNADFSRGNVKMPYRTAVGVLGYEWDSYSDDCYQPEGSFTMSSSTKMVCIDMFKYLYYFCKCIYTYI